MFSGLDLRDGALTFCDNPYRMHNAGNVAKQGEENIEPELASEADLKKNTQWRKHNGTEYTD